MLARLIEVQSNLIEDAGDIIEQNQQEYLKLVKEQLLAGEDVAYNKIIPDYKQEKYATIKERRNPLPGFGTPDLYYTGAMFEAMRIARDANQLTIISDVDYFESLQKKYDSGLLGNAPVFGLNEDNKDIFRQTILYPLLRQRINARLSI